MVVMTILPNILIGALAGVLVDRWDRKAVMFFSHFLRAMVVLLFLVSSESLAWIYILAALVGIITQFFFPAEGATIPEVVKDKKLLLSANSLFTLTFFASVVVGNVLAGPFLKTFGAHTTFLIVAGAFLVASIFTSRLPGLSVWKGFLKSKRDGLGTGLLQNFMEGLDYIHRHEVVRHGIYFMALGQGMLAILGAIAPGFADRVLGLEVAQVSIYIMAPAAFGMIVGGGILGQFFGGANKMKLIKIGVFGASLALVVFSQVDRFGILFHTPILLSATIFLICLGIANSMVEIPVNTLIQENTEEVVRSRVYGVIATISGTAAILPVIGAGTIADFFGVRAVMFFSGFVLVGLGLIGFKKSNVSSHS